MAGRAGFDLVAVNAFQFVVLKEKGLIQPYLSPERAAYKKGFKDPSAYWVDLWDNYFVIAYNSKLVPAEKRPQVWEDLLDPQWNGKIGMDPGDYQWYIGIVSQFGKDRGLKFMRSLAQQQIRWRSGHPLLLQLMAAGEFDLSVNYAHTVEREKEKGTPVDWVSTLDPIPVDLHPVGIAAKAHNPNSAKLLMDFILSREGQMLLSKTARLPARPDVEPPFPSLDPKRLKLMPIPLEGTTRILTDHVKEFRKIFGL